MGERIKGIPRKCPQEQKCEGKAGGWTISVEGTKSSAVWLKVRCLGRGKA